MWRWSMLGTVRRGASATGKTCDSRRRGRDSSGLDGRHGSGTLIGGNLDRARRLREGAYGTGSPHDLAGLQSEGTGAGRRGTEDGEAEEVRGNGKSKVGLFWYGVVLGGMGK